MLILYSFFNVFFFCPTFLPPTSLPPCGKMGTRIAVIFEQCPSPSTQQASRVGGLGSSPNPSPCSGCRCLYAVTSPNGIHAVLEMHCIRASIPALPPPCHGWQPGPSCNQHISVWTVGMDLASDHRISALPTFSFHVVTSMQSCMFKWILVALRFCKAWVQSITSKSNPSIHLFIYSINICWAPTVPIKCQAWTAVVLGPQRAPNKQNPEPSHCSPSNGGKWWGDCQMNRWIRETVSLRWQYMLWRKVNLEDAGEWGSGRNLQF